MVSKRILFLSMFMAFSAQSHDQDKRLQQPEIEKFACSHAKLIAVGACLVDHLIREQFEKATPVVKEYLENFVKHLNKNEGLES